MTAMGWCIAVWVVIAMPCMTSIFVKLLLPAMVAGRDVSGSATASGTEVVIVLLVAIDRLGISCLGGYRHCQRNCQ